MNSKQRQNRLKRWARYRDPIYRRWHVYSTFLTGFAIGLFYVFLISGRITFGVGPSEQQNLVLIFSGILGGVIYTILVDEHVEMPQFVVGKSNQFKAGLFGDILLGIAGAIVLDFVRQRLAPDIVTNAVEMAAAGIIGGYGGRAILQFALQRVFKDINLLEADRQQYLQKSLQRRIERMDSLTLIDLLNQQIKTGLSGSALEELIAEIRQTTAATRTRIFSLAQEFRLSAKATGEKARIERTFPIFEALVQSDPEQHQYYAELAFAHKDADSSDLATVIQYLNKAIALRGEQQRAETWNYELSRAITRIEEAYQATGTYRFDPAVHDRIIDDLLSVAEIYNLKNILKAVSDETIPLSVMHWMQHNQEMLATHPKAKGLLEQLDSQFPQSPETPQPRSIEETTPTTPPLEPEVDLPVEPAAPGEPEAPAVSQFEKAMPAAAIALVKEFEGYHTELPDGRAEAYADAIHGWQVPTIGYGTTRYPDGRQVQAGDIITRAQAEKYLAFQLRNDYGAALKQIPTWNKMHSNQQSALYSFAYNLGAHFYRGADFASITRVCDSPNRWTDKAWVEEQFIKYRNPGTSAEVGLLRRRRAEAKLFCTPVKVTAPPTNPDGREAPNLPISLTKVIPLVDLDADAVRWVKQQLARAGYYTGKLDGVVNDAMLSAFKAFKTAFFLDGMDKIGPDTIPVLSSLQPPSDKPDIMLSKHFRLSEMIFSETAARDGIDNYPADAAVIENLKALCQNVLEPVRERFQKPITPSSGYRSPALNAAVNGSSSSQHVVGEAVDFMVPGVAIPEACRWINSNLEFDQLILEYYEPSTNGGWIHCSYRRNGGNRHQYFSIP